MTSEQQVHQDENGMPHRRALARMNTAQRCTELIHSLDDRSTTIRARRHRSLFLDHNAVEIIYIVGAGFLFLECAPAGERRRILRLFYPGDIIRASFAPPIRKIGIVAAMPSELLRSKWRKFEDLMNTEKVISGHYHQRLANQEARLALHASVLGGLVAEARVTSLLIEFALRMGQRTGDGVSFDLPFSRSDMADYLALNADTLSRIISRLKAKGLLTQLGRERMFAHNWQALLDENPISAALVALHGA